MEVEVLEDGKFVIFLDESIKKKLTKYAENNIPVLFTGKEGTGKELYARFYHKKSGREKYLPLDCAGIPETLFASELFGHVKGAFTGALRDRPGLIESCKDGVIVLDEIGDTSGHFQASLLRVIEYGDYKKVGADQLH